MKILKNFFSKEKKLMKQPGTIMAVWIAFGVVFGIGIDNLGAGIAVGVAIGVSLTATKRHGSESTKSPNNATDEEPNLEPLTHHLAKDSN